MTDDNTTDHEHTDIESVVERSFDERADDLDDTDGGAGLGAVLDRVQVRKRRRRQVAAVGTVVAVTALGAGAVSLLADGPTDTIAGGAQTSEETTPDESTPIATTFATIPVTTAAAPVTTPLDVDAVEATTPVSTVPPGPQSSPDEQVYVVVAGDSVFRIASIHGIEDAGVLAAYNEWPDGIDHTIVPGDAIRIPPDSLIPPTATTVPGGELVEDDAVCVYTIVEGDNPSKIADRFGISVLDLAGANDDTVMSTFLIGAQLVIPGVDDCG